MPLREKALRQAQAEWKPPADRPDPLDILNERDHATLLAAIRTGRIEARTE